MVLITYIQSCRSSFSQLPAIRSDIVLLIRIKTIVIFSNSRFTSLVNMKATITRFSFSHALQTICIRKRNSSRKLIQNSYKNTTYTIQHGAFKESNAKVMHKIIIYRSIILPNIFYKTQQAA